MSAENTRKELRQQLDRGEIAPAWQKLRQLAEMSLPGSEQERLGARIVQVAYDWLQPGPLGYHLDARVDGQVGRIQRLNDALRERLPPGAYFVDLPLISGDLGRRSMYDPRGYFWTKNPFSAEGTAWLARHTGRRAACRDGRVDH